MTKQCGTCKWFDSEGLDLKKYKYFLLACNYPLPISVDQSTSRLLNKTEGKKCPVYEERKQ